MFASCSVTYLHQFDNCGLQHFGLHFLFFFFFNGYAKLLEIGRNSCACRSRESQTCWVGDVSGCSPGKDVVSFQNLCTDPCNTMLSNIMLQHEADERDNSESSRGMSVHSNYHQSNAPMSVVRIANPCPYPNPIGTTGHHSQCWYELTAHPHNGIHAVCHLPGPVYIKRTLAIKVV